MMLDDIWVGVCTLSSSASYYLTLLRLRTPGLVLVMLASAEEQRRSYRTQETPGHTATLSPLQSSEHAAEKCTCVLCSGNIAKNVLFSRKIWPDISFCQQSCIALHYVYCFAFGILIDLIMNNYNRNKACFNEYLRSSINIFMDGSRYVEMMSDIIV